MTLIKSEKGATLIEFVLVLPILVMFLFAIIEFSVMMYDKAVVTLGSREGARAAVVWRPETNFFLDTTEVGVEIDHFLGVVGTDPPTRLISFGNATTALDSYIIEWSPPMDINGLWNWDSSSYDPSTDEYMRVIVRYRYDFMVLRYIPEFIGLPDNITLQGETIMRMENPNSS